MVLIDNQKVKKFTKKLYLKEDDLNKEWIVICPVCHKVITKEPYYKGDEIEPQIMYLERWSQQEVIYHRKEVENNDS
jgi:DUF438 domain-containing protein